MDLDFFETLTLVFVVAKITGYISWDWVMVFLPAMISLLLSVMIGLFAFYTSKER